MGRLWQIRMSVSRGRAASLRTCCSRQSSIDRNSNDDQAEDDCREQQQPAPILARLAQSTDEMSAIVIGDNCDDSITSSTADSDDCQKSPETIVRSTCHPEKHACRKWKWYRCRGGESTGSPFVKKAENGIQLPISELAVQVGRSGPSCDSEREEGSDHRPCGRDCRILVPRIAVAGSEYCRQNVGTTKCWQWRAIENCEEEKPQCSQVAEHRGQSCPRFRLAFWMKAFNMGAIYQLCWTILRTAFSAPGATPFPRGVKRRIAIKPESGVRSHVSYPESAMHPRCVASRRGAQVENWLPAKISEAALLPNRSCQSAYYDPFLAQPRDRLLSNPDAYLRSPCALSFPANS